MLFLPGVLSAGCHAQEANKLLHLEDSLEYAIRVYEDVRAKVACMPYFGIC